MELESSVHELLALRSQRRIDGLHREVEQRRKEEHVQTGRNATITDQDARLVTSRSGFLREQLQIESLTPLKRLHTALQLEEIACIVSAAPPEDTNNSAALEPALSAIGKERKCFDIVYSGTPTRTVDLRETLFDSSDLQLRAYEALAFSSSRQGYTMRVVIFTTDKGGDVLVRSSLYVPDIQAEARRLISEDNSNAAALVERLWTHAIEP